MSHEDVQRGTKQPLRTCPKGEPKLAAAQGGSGGYLGCPGMLRRSPVMMGCSPQGWMRWSLLMWECVSVWHHSSSNALRCPTGEGDRDQTPPAAPKMPRAPAQHSFPPIKPWKVATGGLSTHKNRLCQVVPTCTHVLTTLYPVWYQAAGNSIPGTQNPGPGSHPLCGVSGCQGIPWPKCPPAAETLRLQKIRFKPEFGPNPA